MSGFRNKGGWYVPHPNAECFAAHYISAIVSGQQRGSPVASSTSIPPDVGWGLGAWGVRIHVVRVALAPSLSKESEGCLDARGQRACGTWY